MSIADVLTEQQLVEQEYDRVVREDIELFRSQAALKTAGKMTDDELRPQRLRRGVYSQRQPDVHMIRTKVPGGLLTSDQMRQTGARRRRIRGRQGPPHHAPEHSVSFCAAAAGRGSAEHAGRRAADHARSLLQHGAQRDRVPAGRDSSRRAVRCAAVRAPRGVCVSAQGTHRQLAAQIQDRLCGLPGGLHRDRDQ